MSKINHARPELVYRDNMRRELSRIAEIWPNESNPIDVPEILRPFTTIPETLNALGKVLEEFNKYLDEPRETFSLTPPSDAIALRKACREFGIARIKNPYDRLYSVRDWLKETAADPSTTNPIYEWLLESVEAS